MEPGADFTACLLSLQEHGVWKEPALGQIVVSWTPLEMAGYFVSMSFAGTYACNQSETRDYLGMLRERIAQAVGSEPIEARITLEGAIAHNRSLQED